MSNFNIDGLKSTAMRACFLAGCKLPVFPVHANKKPASPHGFKDAIANPDLACDLFKKHPAPLIGVATGEASGLDVLDLDLTKHLEAAEWYALNKYRIPHKQVHKTRSGGLHIFFNHHTGLRCSVGRPVPGLDVRADGGGIIWWPAEGYEVLANDGAAEWPTWLLDEIHPPQIEQCYGQCDVYCFTDYHDAVWSACSKVSNAYPGMRNNTLNKEMWSLMRFVGTHNIPPHDIARELAVAAFNAGLGANEIKATLASAIRAYGV